MNGRDISTVAAVRSEDDRDLLDASALEQPSTNACASCGRPAFMTPDPPFNLLCQFCGARSPSPSITPTSTRIAAAVPETAAEPASAGAWALWFASWWLAVVAALGVAAGLLVAWFTAHPFFGGDPSDPDYAARVGPILGVVVACGLAAIVCRRASAPARPLAGLIAFAMGIVVVVALLALAVAPLLPPDGLYGIDLYAVWTAARLPASVAILVPAALAVYGTVARWCATDDARISRRRAVIAAAVALAIVAPVGTLVAVDAAQPACGLGRTCVPAAGISFVLPAGWSGVAPESTELLAATAGSGDTRFVIEDGARVLSDDGHAVPTDIAGVAAEVSSLVGGGGGFTRHTGVSTELVELPVGSAVRVSYTSATSFFLVYYQTTITHWFFVGGRLVVLEYMRAYGEGTPGDPSRDPPDYSQLLGSLRPL
jgi:hypothetical protein